jgi:hypothetical protein
MDADALCFCCFRVAAALRAAARRFLVRTAFLPAALSRRVRAAFLPAALSFLVLAAFFAAARRSAIVILLVRPDIINQHVDRTALTGGRGKRGSRLGAAGRGRPNESFYGCEISNLLVRLLYLLSRTESQSLPIQPHRTSIQGNSSLVVRR